MTSATFFGRRSADIEEMIAALDASLPDSRTDPPAPVAGALGPVADDAENLNPQVDVEGTEPEGVDLDVMEHTRQNRLRSWQKPADIATRRS